MVKEKKPIAKKTTKKPAPKRTPSKRKAKKSVQKEIPTWVRYLLYVLVIIVFVSYLSLEDTIIVPGSSGMFVFLMFIGIPAI